jgi:hypothetical protein
LNAVEWWPLQDSAIKLRTEARGRSVEDRARKGGDEAQAIMRLLLSLSIVEAVLLEGNFSLVQLTKCKATRKAVQHVYFQLHLTAFVFSLNSIKVSII